MRDSATAHSETVMAFDFGARRIGIAIGETLMASPDIGAAVDALLGR